MPQTGAGPTREGGRPGVLVVLIWPQLPNIAHADEAHLRAVETHPGP
jgi:hypothetical protein